MYARIKEELTFPKHRLLAQLGLVVLRQMLLLVCPLEQSSEEWVMRCTQ